jgi:hypothetical protein
LTACAHSEAARAAAADALHRQRLGGVVLSPTEIMALGGGAGDVDNDDATIWLIQL